MLGVAKKKKKNEISQSNKLLSSLFLFHFPVCWSLANTDCPQFIIRQVDYTDFKEL